MSSPERRDDLHQGANMIIGTYECSQTCKLPYLRSHELAGAGGPWPELVPVER